VKKLLLILVLFLGFIGSTYADFESWFNASNECQKTNNLEKESNQKETIIQNLESMAKEGVARASHCLGQLYEDGFVTRDAQESFTWYLKAAELGYPSALYKVGFMYQQGEGVIEDHNQALNWFKKAAESGDSRAINQLAVMYEFGSGVAKNYKEAIFWTKLAIELELPYQEKLNKLELLAKTEDEEIKRREEAERAPIEQAYQDALENARRLSQESIQLKADLDLVKYQLDLLNAVWEAKDELARDEINKLKQTSASNNLLISDLKSENEKIEKRLSSVLQEIEKNSQELLQLKAELVEQLQAKELLIENHLNILKSTYMNAIVASVKSKWQFFGIKNDWVCDVRIIQDEKGVVKEVDINNCIIDESYKENLFMNSIERAIYKASPLPLAPDEAVFDREILFRFVVD
ncbi:uncharacterized protein METZ01_LOCUS198206, partial [marine metagenome]